MKLKLLRFHVTGAAMAVMLSGCWSPLIVGEPLMDNDKTIYGIICSRLLALAITK